VRLEGQEGGSFQDWRRRPRSGQDRDEPLGGGGQALTRTAALVVDTKGGARGGGPADR
jgi:hypothetical protein